MQSQFFFVVVPKNRVSRSGSIIFFKPTCSNVENIWHSINNVYNSCLLRLIHIYYQLTPPRLLSNV